MGSLSVIERAALGLGRWVHGRRIPSAIAGLYGLVIARPWMTLVTKRRILLVGLEHVQALAPSTGVILASNHRSFFDMFLIACYLSWHTRLVRRLLFPVRSSFFYDRVLGVALNAAVCGFAMYPPIFREPEKKSASVGPLEDLAAALAKKGTIVGMHPEGRRGKGADPYELLPADPTFGRLALSARVPVIPVFINGLSNDLPRECWKTMRGERPKIGIVFGAPLSLDDLADEPHRVRNQLAASKRVLEAIAALGARDRELREARAA